MTNELPAEIAELRDLADTAAANLAAAESIEEAAQSEAEAAAAKAYAAQDARQAADNADQTAHRKYIDALRRHGWVQTADGPKPDADRAKATPELPAGWEGQLEGELADMADKTRRINRLAGGAR